MMSELWQCSYYICNGGEMSHDSTNEITDVEEIPLVEFWLSELALVIMCSLHKV
jgi:hypothetical protein